MLDMFVYKLNIP
jgi:hypothetical protein